MSKKGQPCVDQGPLVYLYIIYSMHKCIIREAFLSTLAKVGMTKYIAICKCVLYNLLCEIVCHLDFSSYLNIPEFPN